MRFREQLESIYKSMQNKSVKDIMKIVRREAPSITLTDTELQSAIYTLKGEDEEVISIDNTNDWSVDDGNYVFKRGTSMKVFSIELIDNIFKYYSRKGQDYTRIAVQQRFGLTPKTFHQIVSVFNLSKDCDIISPYTKQNNSPEDVLNIIDKTIDEVLDSGERTTQKYQQKVARKNRKNVEDMKLDQGWRQEIISDMLAEYPMVSEIKVSRDNNNKVDEISVILADIHAGGKSEKTKLSGEWSVDEMIIKLNRIAKVANSYKAAKVNLVILGDLVETVSGINHPDSWKGIEGGMFGSNVIIQTQEMLVKELINKVTNLNKIVATGGNHDRLQASNKMSDVGATDLIFYMIGERLKLTKSTVELIYDPVIVSFKTGAFGIIGVHGDKGLHNRELSYVTQKFAADRDQYQFVFSAHLHSFFCKRNDDQEFGRRVTIPAIITGNDYSDIQIGRASKSGVVVVKENMFNEPDMIVHNL